MSAKLLQMSVHPYFDLDLFRLHSPTGTTEILATFHCFPARTLNLSVRYRDVPKNSRRAL